jgi:hypothetical protein
VAGFIRTSMVSMSCLYCKAELSIARMAGDESRVL